jgi:peptide/nickel transport system substrate-binding protein
MGLRQRRNKIRQRSGFFLKDRLLWLGGLFLLFAPCHDLLAEPVSGDAIVVASASDARTLIPILASDSSSAEICGLLFNGLVKYDKDLNIVGDLAESWEIKEGGLVIVFHLKKNVRWHDGYPFSAEDVVFTYQRIIDPHVPTPYASDFLKVSSCEAVDPLTVRVTYREPFAPALMSWGLWIMPKHILEGVDLNQGSFPKKIPIGTGPYKFKNWARQEKIELVANADYFDQAPFITRYISRVIPDPATLFFELETLGVDAAGLSPLQFTRQTTNKLFNNAYRKFRTPGFQYTYLAYNLTDERFSDKRVRRALSYAVNTEQIIRIVLLGLGRPITGPFLPQSWAYDQSVQPMAFDPDRARTLLTDAGWIDTDHDGWVEKNGEEFTFTILVNQGLDVRTKTAELIQKYLKDVGVRVKIKVLEWSALLTEFIDKRRFEAVLLGWSLSKDPDVYDIWHSSKTKEGEFNFISFKNAEVDKQLEEGRRTFDIEKRAACYHRIHRIIAEEQPVMFLFAPDSLDVISSRIEGIAPAPAGISYNFTKWWVPKDKQRYRPFLQG